MNIKINIRDVKQILKDYQVPTAFRTEVSRAVRSRIMVELHQSIAEMARTELHSTKKAYLDAIDVSENSIQLFGWLGNSIESGVGAFDMKEYFKGSNKIKFNKKGGWYLTVPFRIYTPDTSDFNTQMSWQIYRSVLANKPYDPGPTKERPGFSDSLTKTTFASYQHKSPILQGINRNTSGDRSTYNTFRRVGENSASNSWIHRGIQAHNFFDRSWERIDLDKIFSETINEFL